MRWLLLCATGLSWVLCVTRHSAGAFGFWLLMGIVGAIATVLGFAQARIEANAQPEMLLDLPVRRPPPEPPQEHPPQP
ncbi:hypothetical protein [Dyella sp.]|uniref:hypothetical protein n=1 Tax=Dyella sp. TaxID=1869338 RepID=UPI002D783BCA|nr:hypothetical protein [Dyella sp.]HET7333138.1 hypothetical protein [Dyella sp.]